MTVYECGNDMFIIDCGLAFPDETMLGIDIVIPDFTYVIQNKEKFAVSLLPMDMRTISAAFLI